MKARSEVKKMKSGQNSWWTWRLSKDDLEIVMDRLDFDITDFSDTHLEKIARLFTKAIECACEEWEQWLEYAILDVAKDEGIKPPY